MLDTVHIISATLPSPKENENAPATYAKLFQLNDGAKFKVGRTHTVNRSVSPKYDAEFKIAQVRGRHYSIEIWRHNAIVFDTLLWHHEFDFEEGEQTLSKGGVELKVSMAHNPSGLECMHQDNFLPLGAMYFTYEPLGHSETHPSFLVCSKNENGYVSATKTGDLKGVHFFNTKLDGKDYAVVRIDLKRSRANPAYYLFVAGTKSQNSIASYHGADETKSKTENGVLSLQHEDRSLLFHCTYSVPTLDDSDACLLLKLAKMDDFISLDRIERTMPRNDVIHYLSSNSL